MKIERMSGFKSEISNYLLQIRSCLREFAICNLQFAILFLFAICNLQSAISQIYGDGADGPVTIAANKNINTDVITPGRIYADGVNYAVGAIGASSATTTTSPDGIAAGDEVLLINMQGTTASNGNVGNWEILTVSNIIGNQLNFTSPITKVYGATTSNSDLTGQKIMVQRVPNYSSLTINDGVTLTCNAWDGTKGGVIAFRCSGTLTLGSTGSAVIDASAKGYRGGATPASTSAGGPNGESYDGIVGAGGNQPDGSGTSGGGGGAKYPTGYNGGGSANRGGGGGGGGGNYAGGGGGGGGYAFAGGGGGGGAYVSAGLSGGAGGISTNANAGGGGGAGYQSNGGAGGNTGNPGASIGSPGGAGGAAGSGAACGGGGGGSFDGGTTRIGGGGGGGGGSYGDQYLTKIYCGSGGGAGGSSAWAGSYGAAGGNGGGIIIIYAKTVTINATGAIRSNGGAGNAYSSYAGDGGGGAGGSIFIYSDTATLGTNLVTATGGPGGNNGGWEGKGGQGGVGRIRVDSITVSGTTNPAASVQPNSASNVQVEGATNPTSVADASPDFSATYTSSTGASGVKMWVQVTSSIDTSYSSIIWDSNWIPIAAVPSGSVSQQVAYAGPALQWGSSYRFRIRFLDTAGGAGRWSLDGTFTMAKPSVTLPNNGWNMISVPRSDNAIVYYLLLDDLPGVVVYQYDEPSRQYQVTTSLIPGRGYFLSYTPAFVDTDDGTALYGNYTVPSLSYTTGTGTAGWNLIGNPYNGTIDWELAWDGPDNNGIPQASTVNIDPTFYYWNGTAYAEYNANTNTGLNGGVKDIPAWRGFFIRATAANPALTLTEPSTISSAPSPGWNANWWQLTLDAQAAGGARDQGGAGITPTSSDSYGYEDSLDLGTLANPYVNTYFDHTTDWPTNPGKYSMDFRQARYNIGDQITWIWTVSTNTGEAITISFPNIADLPTTDWEYRIDGQLITPGLTLTWNAPAGTQTKTYTITATRLTNFVGNLVLAAGTANPADTAINSTTAPVAMTQIQLTAQLEGITVTQIKIIASGTGNDAAGVTAVNLYNDINGNGIVDGADVLLAGPGLYSADDGTITFSVNQTVAINETQKWVVSYQFNGTPGTYRASVVSTDITGTGATSGKAITGTGGTVNGGLMTIGGGENPQSANNNAKSSGGCYAGNGGSGRFPWFLVLLLTFVVLKIANSKFRISKF